MNEVDISSITIDNVPSKFFGTDQIEVDVLRLDKIHPVVSGNKIFKLKYHLEKFRKGGYKKIVTYGGAWSNHILATAFVCNANKIPCTGIIRGESPRELSPTLRQAKDWNMDLEFISRTEFDDEVKNKYPGKYDQHSYLLPAGGAGEEGARGCGEMLQFTLSKTYSHIVAAMGTGTMALGLSNAASPEQRIIGVSVVKRSQIEDSVPEIFDKENVKIFYDYDFGGYARFAGRLFHFMNEFYSASGIPTDFVYTGKLFYGMNDLARKGFFKQGSSILAIHSGGLQGNRSLRDGVLQF